MSWWNKFSQSQRMIGYKVMRLENGRLVSGADSRISLPAEVGAIHTMPGQGIFIGRTPEYVKDYYSSWESEG